MKKSLEQLIEMAKRADQEQRPAEAVEIFKAAYNMDQSISPYLLVRLADSLRIIGRFDESKKVFDTIQDEDVPATKLWLLYLHKGQLLIDIGDSQTAISCFQRAVELHPKETVPYVYLASLYIRTQDPEAAISVLLRGLEVPGDVDEVYLNLGYCYRTLGKYALARNAFARALEITPDDPKAKSALLDVDAALDIMLENE